MIKDYLKQIKLRKNETISRKGQTMKINLIWNTLNSSIHIK